MFLPHFLNTLAAAGSLPQVSSTLDTLVRAEVFFPLSLLIIGALILLFGFKAYQWIVVFNCIALGFWIGGLLGAKAQVTTVAAVIGAVLLGVISWPMMKYAVALCGGLVGAIVGMVAWAYFQLPIDLAWAGGLAGLILLGMLSFILFKGSIILFTCIQGAAMLVLGASALIINYTPWNRAVHDNLAGKPILLPLLVFSVALLGLIFQQQKHGLLDGGGSAKTTNPTTGSTPEKPKK